MTRQALWAVAAGLWLAQLHPAWAAGEPEVCREAYIATQRLQRSAHLREARRQAIACGQDACSKTIRLQCIQWLEDIERATPTLSIDARDAAGAPLTDVRVLSGGELLAEGSSGRALELDPGDVVLTFEHGGQALSQRLLVREGEKYRSVQVRFGAGAPAKATPTQSSSATDASPPALPVASYVLGATSIAGLISFGVVGLSAYASERRLSHTCGRACDTAAVDDVRTRYQIADVALGVAVTSLAGAIVAWRWWPADGAELEPTSGASRPKASASLSAGPGSLVVSGEF